MLGDRSREENNRRKKSTMLYQRGKNPMSDRFQSLIKKPQYQFTNKKAMSKVGQERDMTNQASPKTLVGATLPTQLLTEQTLRQSSKDQLIT